MRVAQPAASALGDQHALADDRQVGDLLELAGLGIVLEDERADRHRDVEVAGRRGPCGARLRRCRRAGAL